MTIDNCIETLTSILDEATASEDAVCYVTSADAPALKKAIDTMRKYQKFQDQSLSLYMERLKADMVAMLTELQLEIEELDTPSNGDAYMTCSDIIQQKINALKAESEGT